MLSTSVGPEWSLCRGQLAVPGHKSPRKSKNVIHTSWPHLDDQVEAFQVGVTPIILKIEVTLRLIHTYSTLVTPFFNVYWDSHWLPLSVTQPDKYLNFSKVWENFISVKTRQVQQHPWNPLLTTLRGEGRGRSGKKCNISKINNYWDIFIV